MRRYLSIAAGVVREARWLTRERLLLCGSGLAFVTIGTFALDAAGHALPGLTNEAGEHLGRDFLQFWTSAKLAAAGTPAAAYVLGAPDHIADQAIAYPPIVMLLCRPLAGLSYATALLVWGMFGLALYSWSLSRLIGWEIAVFAAIGTPAAFLNIYLQQNGYYTAALLALGLMLVERRPAFAGLLLGILCYKPQFGVLLLPALIAGGHRRVLFMAAATALVLAATATILFGVDTWIAFFDRMSLQRDFMETRAVAWAWMPTIFTMVKLAGAGSPAAYALQAVSAAGAAVAVAVLWRGRCPLGVKSAGLAIATFLATPYAWDYDAVILTFAAAWLAGEGIKTGFHPWEKITVLVLLTLPALSVVPAKLLNFQIAPILLWLSLAVVLRRGLGWRFAMTVPAIRDPSPQSTA
jgi:alpha-1,2-mannosyltransferase